MDLHTLYLSMDVDHLSVGEIEHELLIRNILFDFQTSDSAKRRKLKERLREEKNMTTVPPIFARTWRTASEELEVISGQIKLIYTVLTSRKTDSRQRSKLKTRLVHYRMRVYQLSMSSDATEDMAQIYKIQDDIALLFEQFFDAIPVIRGHREATNQHIEKQISHALETVNSEIQVLNESITGLEVNVENEQAMSSEGLEKSIRHKKKELDEQTKRTEIILDTIKLYDEGKIDKVESVIDAFKEFVMKSAEIESKRREEEIRVDERKQQELEASLTQKKELRDVLTLIEGELKHNSSTSTQNSNKVTDTEKCDSTSEEENKVESDVTDKKVERTDKSNKKLSFLLSNEDNKQDRKKQKSKNSEPLIKDVTSSGTDESTFVGTETKRSKLKKHKTKKNNDRESSEEKSNKKKEKSGKDYEKTKLKRYRQRKSQHKSETSSDSSESLSSSDQSESTSSSSTVTDSSSSSEKDRKKRKHGRHSNRRSSKSSKNKSETKRQLKRIPVADWKLKYDGKDGGRKLAEFLKEVKLRCRSEDFTEKELFRSAIHLFAGRAKDWYMEGVENCDFKSWAQLKKELKREFRPHDLDFQLEIQATHRKQARGEKFSDYFYEMQKIFQNMSKQISDNRKFELIWRNMRHDYKNSLTGAGIKSLSKLRKFGRIIDENNWNLYQKPSENIIRSRPNQVSEIVETEQGNTKSKTNVSGNKTKVFTNTKLNKAKFADQGKSNVKDKTATKTSEGKSDPMEGTSKSTMAVLVDQYKRPPIGTCYNCKESGHHYGECPSTKRKFCRLCGFSDVYTSTCPYCQKNVESSA